MANKRMKSDSESRVGQRRADSCFPDSDGSHADELVNGKITWFMLTWPKGAATPTEHAVLVADGITPYTGLSLLHVRSKWSFGQPRDAATVPVDLYKIWYAYYRGRINFRRDQMREFEKDVSKARRRLHEAVSKYVLPGDWEFESASDDSEDSGDDE
jgi:hypothetical protein